jgi:hypothetical protein
MYCFLAAFVPTFPFGNVKHDRDLLPMLHEFCGLECRGHGGLGGVVVLCVDGSLDSCGGTCRVGFNVVHDVLSDTSWHRKGR